MKPAFRLGTTSYILPEAILPNARFLAGKVQDIELLLFEVDDESNVLPDAGVVDELRSLARAHDLSYTVHLPLALDLGEEGPQAEAALTRSEHVIEALSPLDPIAYVAHLGPKPETGVPDWIECAAAQLLRLCERAGDPQRIAVENPGGAHPGMAVVLDRTGASRCVDVGHLWHAGQDPLPELAEFRSRLRVVHLHGSSERDHQSLARVPRGALVELLQYLGQTSFDGVVTLEVFGLEDLTISLRAVEEAWEST